jgi:hypothetical protein
MQADLKPPVILTAIFSHNFVTIFWLACIWVVSKTIINIVEVPKCHHSDTLKFTK